MLGKRILTIGLIGMLTLGLGAGTVLADETEDEAKEADHLEELMKNTEEDGVPGAYKIDGMDYGDEEVDEDTKAFMDSMLSSMYLYLYEDGTGAMVIFGAETEVEWDEKTITIEGEGTPYTLEDRELTIAEDGVSMSFVKMTAEELENIDTVGALQPGDYDPNTRAGYYKVSTLEEDGEVMDASVLELIGMEIYLVLNEDNTGRLSLMGTDTELKWDDEVISAEGEKLEYSYDAGTIIVETEDGTITLVYAGKPDEAPKPGEAAE